MTYTVYLYSITGGVKYASDKALTVYRADNAHSSPVEHVGIYFGGGDILVPQQLLDGANVVAILEESGVGSSGDR